MTLEVRNLTFAYQKKAAPVLRDVSFQIQAGTSVALLGPNGCGKSTLLALLNGRLRPSAGNALFDGRAPDCWPPKARARRIALVSQFAPAALGFTVREMVDMGRNPFLGLPASPAEPAEPEREQTDQLLERLELKVLADRTFSELSGGERQRVMIAAALIRRPDYLLLDEPTSAADPARKIALMRLLTRELDWHPAVLTATHDLQAAAAFADRILLLSNGTIRVDGPPESVLTPESIREVFGCEAELLRTAAGRLVPVIL